MINLINTANVNFYSGILEGGGSLSGSNCTYWVVPYGNGANSAEGMVACIEVNRINYTMHTALYAISGTGETF